MNSANLQKQALRTIFGSSLVAPSTVSAWKLSWFRTGFIVSISSFNRCVQVFRDNDIPPIYYQLSVIDQRPVCILFLEEHAILLKLSH
jgi:hypothetical protein